MLSALRQSTILPLLLLLQLLVEVASQNLTEPAGNATVTAKHGTFKYFIFSEQCYETFILQHNFYDIPCLKLVQAPLPRLSPRF
jgi:hypothetical protein